MSLICPTILATDPHEYRQQLERVQDFSKRIQVDLMDGEFTKTKSINPIQVWWSGELAVDIHLMFRRPIEQIETLVSLRPHMVIIQAEAEGDLSGLLKHLKQCGLKTGVCLLKDTTVAAAANLIMAADHVLIFGGSLGSFGGLADLSQLSKISGIRSLRPDIEIGWDGGANEANVEKLDLNGIDVINVGSAIQSAPNARQSYDTLELLIHKQ